MPKAATRGPVPKRSSERRRRNKDSKVETVKPLVANVPPLTANEAWHPIAIDWFNSLAESGQSQFYEPSDWQAARLVADVMSRNLKQKKFSSVLFAAVWTAMGDLLTTEADRRRVRMEVERGGEPEQPAGVIAIADYRKSLSAAGSSKS
jgi:hypothetical protein